MVLSPKGDAFTILGSCEYLKTQMFVGVTDGARTHDNRNHNPGLYQLSYGHHCVLA